ncbi:hypothetical protein PHISP_08688 [Aspergillus sp. HF37]|nr:hypothetical protein PHISP_08688 [Aspergillus sp. HF37]
MAPNKTDANDADGLAHLAEIGFYREVRVKGYDSSWSARWLQLEGALSGFRLNCPIRSGV